MTYIRAKIIRAQIFLVIMFIVLLESLDELEPDIGDNGQYIFNN